LREKIPFIKKYQNSSKISFRFEINNSFIYYSNDQNNLNILGGIPIEINYIYAVLKNTK
jgi:hypothetical protein